MFFACSFAAGCGGYGFPGGGSGSSGPAKTVEDFWRSFSEGDCDAAASLVIPEERQDDYAMCVEARSHLQKMGGSFEVEILNEEIQGNQAWVDFRITSPDGTDHEEHVRLLLIDGAWLLRD